LPIGLIREKLVFTIMLQGESSVLVCEEWRWNSW
jgi:hypothetical protein